MLKANKSTNLDLSTICLALKLKNPIIVSISWLTSEIKDIRKYAERDTGAAVLKALIEEQQPPRFVLHDISM